MWKGVCEKLASAGFRPVKVTLMFNDVFMVISAKATNGAQKAHGQAEECVNQLDITGSVWAGCAHGLKGFYDDD